MPDMVFESSLNSLHAAFDRDHNVLDAGKLATYFEKDRLYASRDSYDGRIRVARRILGRMQDDVNDLELVVVANVPETMYSTDGWFCKSDPQVATIYAAKLNPQTERIQSLSEEERKAHIFENFIDYPVLIDVTEIVVDYLQGKNTQTQIDVVERIKKAK